MGTAPIEAPTTDKLGWSAKFALTGDPSSIETAFKAEFIAHGYTIYAEATNTSTQGSATITDHTVGGHWVNPDGSPKTNPPNNLAQVSVDVYSSSNGSFQEVDVSGSFPP
jgi:hypothetical protein